MLENLQEFTSSLPSVIQWLGVMAAGAIPFVESYLGATIGVIAGVPAPLAIAAAVAGNTTTMLLMVTGAHALHQRLPARQRETSAKRQRLRAAFDKYGIAGVSLVGQTILPSQITSAALVSFGAPRNVVIFWQVISILMWGITFGVLAAIGVDLIGTR